MRRLFREVVGVLAVLFVAAVSAKFAELLRSFILGSIKRLYHGENAIKGIAQTHTVTVVAYIAIAILVARALNKFSQKWRPGQLGLEVIGDAARGEGAGPSLEGTLVRSSATAIACAAGTSLGRESAILETSGALGAFVGKRLWGFGPSIAAGGIAAAFAAAYHAPFGAVLYVGEHLKIFGHRRAMVYAVIASAFSNFLTVHFLGGKPIFYTMSGQWTLGGVAVAALVATVPALIGARSFLRLREYLPKARLVLAYPKTSLTVSVAVAALLVSWFPESAGNGMEAIRLIATPGGVTIAIALVLAFARAIAVAATVNAKAPGGVFAPTLAVSAGWGLAAYLILEKTGLPLGGTHQEVMVISMTIGVAVGLHAPWLGAVVIAEMSGHMGLLPVCMVGSYMSHLMVHGLDRFDRARNIAVPEEMHNEDA
ncbi:MAG: chloride channel protein [Actinomycetes bacterium]